MIHYLVTEQHRYTMEIFLYAEPTLIDRLVVLPYERVTEREALTPGVYIFSDVDRLSGAELRTAVELWRRLSELGPDVRLLNHPSRVLRRYELLRMLHAQGINRFNAFRVPDPLPPDPPISPRFPVFVREREHTGNLSDLLHSWKEVRRAIREIVAGGDRSVEDLLLVEWCDTSDTAGVFRKCSAFVIAGTIVPRDLACSHHWLVKDFALLDGEHLREARAYVAENPHANLLKDIARRANVDYGRFDYALLDGEPQIWELNTNPLVISYPRGQPGLNVDRLSLELHRVPMRRVATALEALDHAPQRQTTDSASGLSTAVAST